jgi:hypothetical protein
MHWIVLDAQHRIFGQLLRFYKRRDFLSKCTPAIASHQKTQRFLMHLALAKFSMQSSWNGQCAEMVSRGWRGTRMCPPSAGNAQQRQIKRVKQQEEINNNTRSFYYESRVPMIVRTNAVTRRRDRAVRTGDVKMDRKYYNFWKKIQILLKIGRKVHIAMPFNLTCDGNWNPVG